MLHPPDPQPTWKELVSGDEPLVLPAAHDALAGTRWAYPDIDLIHFYEVEEALRQISGASPLPVLVDAGDGFGDVKNVARTVRGLEAAGAAALFIEDQKAPVSCGQMGQKEV